MKFKKQTLVRILSVYTLICSALALVFAGKKKGLAYTFAGLSLAGAVGNLFLAFFNKEAPATECECEDDFYGDEEDEEFNPEDIFCDFEDEEEIVIDAE